MKYEKGTFVTVPNRAVLRGMDPKAQTLYMWICSYADERGECYPSYAALAQNCGMSKRSVIRGIESLERKGVIVKKHRATPAGQSTNIYQLILMGGGGDCESLGGDSQSPLGVPHRHGGSDCVAYGTKSNELNPINSIATPTENDDETFNWEEGIAHLRRGGPDGTQKRLKIIALYWDMKKWVFVNKLQFDSALSRELRPANKLVGYTKKEVARSMAFCKRSYDHWTLETVHKRITDLVNERSP